MTTTWPIAIVAALSGLALGSYVVTAGLRTARGEQSSSGRSHCDRCGKGLTALETVPMLSYLVQRGVCRGCAAPIDPLHIAGEIAGMTVVVVAFSVAPPARAFAMAVLGLSLVASTAVDLKVRRLPDAFTVIVAISGVVLAALRGTSQVLAGLTAAAVATGVLLALRAAGRRLRGDPGLGLGDVKLIAALALWLGAATPLMVAAASGMGLLAAPWLRGADRRIPFGPMIAAAGWSTGALIEGGLSPWGL